MTGEYQVLRPVLHLSTGARSLMTCHTGAQRAVGMFWMKFQALAAFVAVMMSSSVGICGTWHCQRVVRGTQLPQQVDPHIGGITSRKVKELPWSSKQLGSDQPHLLGLHSPLSTHTGCSAGCSLRTAPALGSPAGSRGSSILKARAPTRRQEAQPQQ